MVARSGFLGRLVAPLVLLSLVSSILPPTAAADWGNGVVVGQTSRSIYSVQLLRPTLPDLLAVWEIVGNSTVVRAARLTHSGGIVWGTGNLNAYATPFPATPDATGGLFIAFEFIESFNRQVYLEGVHGDGSHVPPTGIGWPVATTSAVEAFPAIAGDGAGGAYVAWIVNGTSARLKRLQADGSLAPGWPADGLLLTASTYLLRVALDADGAGGVYAFWTTAPAGSNETRVLRVGSGGTIAGGWPTGGLLLGTLARHEGLWILPSGAGRMVVLLDRPSAGGSGRLTLQRFLSNGTLDPAWPAAGKVVLDEASSIGMVTSVSDGLDGVTVLWEQSTLPRALHVLSNGTIAPGYPAGGKSPLDAAAQYVPASFSTDVALAGASGRDGGVVFLWRDTRPSRPGVRARWLLADGTNDPREPDSGRVASPPGAPFIYMKAAIDDGQGGIYVAWQQGDYGAGDVPELWVNRLISSELVDVGPAPSSTALALHAPTPNPTNRDLSVRLTLQGDDPARLELLDLGGRRVRAQVLSGAGERTARFDGLDRLVPGVYLLRLTQGRDQRFSRVAIMH